MTDTIRELINRVLDYVARTPGAEFKVFRLQDNYRCHFLYARYDFYGSVWWSVSDMLTEDNLKYLLGRLESEER